VICAHSVTLTVANGAQIAPGKEKFMKVNLGTGAQNSQDWERVLAEDWSRPPATPDYQCVQAALALGDLAEPLGFDGIWFPEHHGTPYGMTPNPIQALTYFAGRTERVSLGTFVAVVPWWNPIRLATQIAYLDIVSNGRYTTIGLGRGVSKGEFAAVGVPREESRQRFNETLDILKLAFSGERFSYEGEIFSFPEMSLRPEPISTDLYDRIYSSSSTAESLEILSRRGMVPLFVGNKPITDAGEEVKLVNTFRAEEGLPPCQPKNVMFMYCVESEAEVTKTEEWIWTANRDVNVHYGFADASNFKGVKGYEAYAAREASATAVLASEVGNQKKGGPPGYHASNLLIGTPETVFEKLKAAQEACSFSEVTIVPQFGTMPYESAMESVKLFAAEVLPAVHDMPAPLHPAVLPESVTA
jgi:alkanesulfonate monooxygenase SsuD/methylene tetrahydromethanopterin reductase-like flavin-dependent oxidoreductase (luciferase family)